jgi:ribosomal protein S18
MPKCLKCLQFFPPGFSIQKEGTDLNFCIFCETDKKSIKHKGVEVTKKEIVEEYKIAMKMIMEKNDILKQSKLEKLSQKIII